MFYKFLLFIILFLSSFLGYYSLFEGHNWGGDFALYMHQAQSIVEGNAEEVLTKNTFSMENSTQMPGSNPQIGPYLYPWGFPLLLVPVYEFFGPDIFIMKVYVLFFYIFSLLVIYHLFKNRVGKVYSLLIIALLGFNYNLLYILDDVGSDVPYTFFALLALLFIQKLVNSKYVINRAFTLIILGVLIFIAFLIRTNGIVLFCTFFLCQIIYFWPYLKSLDRPFRKVRMEVLPYISFGICLLIVKLILPSGSGSHLAFLSRITAGKLAYNLIYYTKLPAEFYSSTPLPFIIFGISIPFLLLGVYRRIGKDYHYLIYSISTLAVFVLWPPIQGLRFILSLMPFYLYFLFCGMLYVEEKIKRKNILAMPKKAWLTGAFAVVLLCFFLFQSLNVALGNLKQRQLIPGPYQASSQEVFRFVDTHTAKDDVIVFFKPRVMNYLTERKAIRIVNYQEILDGKGDYLLICKNENFGQLTEDDLQKIQYHLTVRFENNDFTLYKIGSSSVESGPYVHQYIK